MLLCAIYDSMCFESQQLTTSQHKPLKWPLFFATYLHISNDEAQRSAPPHCYLQKYICPYFAHHHILLPESNAFVQTGFLHTEPTQTRLHSEYVIQVE